jgi:NADH-quinone oxidoreductase subunit F
MSTSGHRIRVGMGTCGLAAGAAKVRDAIFEHAAALGLDLDVKGTGCVGFCSREVIVTSSPGLPKISYGPVGTKLVPATRAVR